VRRPKPPVPPKPPKRKAKDNSYSKVEAKRVQPKSSMGTKRKPPPMPAGKPSAKPKDSTQQRIKDAAKNGKKLMPYDTTKPKKGVKLLPAKPNATAKPKPMNDKMKGSKPSNPIQILPKPKPKPGDTLYKPLPVKPGKQDRLKKLKTIQQQLKQTNKNRKY
jgi:hypothetical protein